MSSCTQTASTRVVPSMARNRSWPNAKPSSTMPITTVPGLTGRDLMACFLGLVPAGATDSTLRGGPKLKRFTVLAMLKTAEFLASSERKPCSRNTVLYGSSLTIGRRSASVRPVILLYRSPCRLVTSDRLSNVETFTQFSRQRSGRRCSAMFGNMKSASPGPRLQSRYGSISVAGGILDGGTSCQSMIRPPSLLGCLNHAHSVFAWSQTQGRMSVEVVGLMDCCDPAIENAEGVRASFVGFISV